MYGFSIMRLFHIFLMKIGKLCLFTNIFRCILNSPKAVLGPILPFLIRLLWHLCFLFMRPATEFHNFSYYDKGQFMDDFDIFSPPFAPKPTLDHRASYAYNKIDQGYQIKDQEGKLNTNWFLWKYYHKVDQVCWEIFW